jgi:hypothetical protein
MKIIKNFKQFNESIKDISESFGPYPGPHSHDIMTTAEAVIAELEGEVVADFLHMSDAILFQKMLDKQDIHVILTKLVNPGYGIASRGPSSGLVIKNKSDEKIAIIKNKEMAIEFIDAMKDHGLEYYIVQSGKY